MPAPNATSIARLLLSVAGALAASASPIFAQAPPSDRAFRGLFAAPVGPPARQTMNLTLTFTEAYDQDVLAEGGAGPNSGVPSLSGYSSMLTARTEYTRHGRRTQLGITAASDLRYYAPLKTVRSTSGSVGLGVSTSLPGGATWLFNQTVAYSPSYLYGLFPGPPSGNPGGLPSPAAPDYNVNDVASYSYGTSTTLTHGLTKRGSLSISGDFRFTDFLHETVGRTDLTSFGVRGEFSRGVGRNSSAKFGYRLRSGDSGFVSGGSTVEHGLEVGIETARRLSESRRATFRLTLGPSTVNVPAAAIGTPAGQPNLQNRRLYRVSGDAAVGYQFGRTWQTRATYSRGLEYVPGLTAPVLTGGVTGSVDGLLSRRVDLSISGGYSNGNSALQAGSSFATYTGDVRLRYALTRTWALYTEYLYYYYDFSGTTQLAPGLPPHLERNGVRAGLTLWLPLLNRR
jgi:hypothetical protein